MPKVVERIKNYDYGNDTIQAAVIEYIDGYGMRKAEIDATMFPCREKPVTDCGYGTALGSLFPKAMLEFDRQELLTYRMILRYMYTSLSEDEINRIFEE